MPVGGKRAANAEPPAGVGDVGIVRERVEEIGTVRRHFARRESVVGVVGVMSDEGAVAARRGRWDFVVARPLAAVVGVVKFEVVDARKGVVRWEDFENAVVRQFDAFEGLETVCGKFRKLRAS